MGVKKVSVLWNNVPDTFCCCEKNWQHQKQLLVERVYFNFRHQRQVHMTQRVGQQRQGGNSAHFSHKKPREQTRGGVRMSTPNDHTQQQTSSSSLASPTVPPAKDWVLTGVSLSIRNISPLHHHKEDSWSSTVWRRICGQSIARASLWTRGVL